MTFTRTFLLGALSVCSLSGCMPTKFEVTATGEVGEVKLKDGDSEKVDTVWFDVKEKDFLKMRIENVEVEGKTPFRTVLHSPYYAAEDFPLGKSKVKLKVKGAAKGIGKSYNPAEVVLDVEVDRKPLTPRVRASSVGGPSCAFTSERVCFSSPSPDMTTGQATYSILAPAGTKVEIMGRTVVAKGMKEPVTTSLDLSKQILSSPINTNVPVAVKVTSPDGLTANPSTSFSVSAGAVNLENVKKGPVRIANEPMTVGPSKVVAMKRADSFTTYLGKGTLPELELVAFASRLPTRTRDCGTYVGQTTGKRVTMSNIAIDEEVVVYERKTGKIRTKKTFMANMPACPTSMSSQFTGVKGTIEEKDIKSYVESFVGK